MANSPEASGSSGGAEPVEAITRTADALNEATASVANGLTEWLDGRPGLPDSFVDPLATLLLLAGLLASAWIVYVVFRPLILRCVRHCVKKSAFDWDDELVGHGVFRWLTHLLPGIHILLLSPGFFATTPLLATGLTTAANLYLLVSSFFVVDSLTNAIQSILSQRGIGQHFNLTAFGQVVKLITALIIFLLAIAILLQKPPLVLLSGIGVIASVLMLVFKDVILGFVAGIQLSSNEMLAVGDWLEMPSHNADGDVEMIGLTTVKVRNWDKTITTIPTHALISQSFRNWRGMSESDGRRIKRSVLVDTNSIRLCDGQMLERYRQVEHIADYLERKEKEVASFNEKLGPGEGASLVNGRRLTNVGTFRAYMEAYLRNHPDINQEMTLLVRQLAPEGRGLPIEIYCFSANKDWAAYEGIQADIFDHFLAVAPEFDLRIFQEPTGLDFRGIGEASGEGG